MSNGTSRAVVYRVEARMNYTLPQEINGMLLGKEWQEITVSQASSGIGVPNHLFSNADRHGYMSYEAAQSLRWWFHAAPPMAPCLETRLVAFDYEETWKATRKAEEQPQEWPRRPWDAFTPCETAAQADKS